MEPGIAGGGHAEAPRADQLPQPVGACLHQLFEQHAAMAPDAIAVREAAVTYSYAEINQQANRLAHHLLTRGVTTEVMVGLYLERSHSFVVGMLAILKAGGAYVPLDPEHPPVRTLGVMKSAALKFIITEPALEARLADAGECELISAHAGSPDMTNPAQPADADQLLYVIHTSGSSGAPKGVLVTHRNVARLFACLQAPLGFNGQDRWSFYHSPAFGYSAWEIWGALAQGGTLVVLPAAGRLTGPEFLRQLREAGVTILSLTPSAFRHHLLESAFDDMATLPTLRMIALSGEAPVAADLKKWFALNPSGRPELLSTYAITETGGQVTWRRMQAEDRDEAWMGQLLEDTQVHLLDENLQSVPEGVAGEICVAGPGLARGYLNLPELTREKFVEMAFGNGLTTRLYRTGDRARLRGDGKMELVGRSDDQVKLSGHRIELGEIEAVLREHPAVVEAAVSLRQDVGATPRLVAYIVGQTAKANASDQPEFWPSIGEYQVYDEVLYHFMTHEPVRTTAYRQALEEHSPGRVVLDIGTGQDALLARFAAEAGAKKVYAIEVIPEAAKRASKLVQGLDLQEKIEIIHGDSAEIDLPELVDVWTQGIIGNIGSSDGIIPIANDARRWMKPGAIAIPSRCLTYFAAVELPDQMRDKPAFDALARQYAEEVFERAGRKFDVRLCVRNFPRSQLMSDPAVFEDLDFSGLIEMECTGRHTFTMTRDACFDGFILWTYVTTTEGVSVDFLENQQAWLPIYFPMSDEGWRLQQGDRIEVEWQRRTGLNGLNPDYTIQATVVDAMGAIKTFHYRSCHHEEAHLSTGIHRRLFAGWEQNQSLPSPQLLRAHLARKLPDYMLPSSYVTLERLPRNANGKLDRQALPAPEHHRPAMQTVHVCAEGALENGLVEIWQEVLGCEGIGVNDDFFELGGNSLQAISITSRLQSLLNEHVYVVAIFDAPTVRKLAEHLRKHYPAQLAQVFSDERKSGDAQIPEGARNKLAPEDVATMRAMIHPLVARRGEIARRTKNPRAVFILSTHRSGSTLFRIMLAGHAKLLAPPELELLGFDNMTQRKEAFSGRDSYWLEGAIRALMQVRQCSVEVAEQALNAFEAQGMDVPEFYALLQREAGGRLLIDKSTHYALNLDSLRQAEAWFEEPLYLHLLRHPCGSIQSYVDTRMEFFFRYEHSFSAAQLAELNWLISQQNIVTFLDEVPQERQLQIRFEDLVAAPEPAMQEVCRFLGVEFDPEVLDPYGDAAVRMTDPVYAHSKMLGDVKFVGHRKIDPTIADRWRGKVAEDSLGDMTWQLARTFGYERTEGIGTAPAEPVPHPESEPIPLSFAQQRMWFVQQFDLKDCANNLTGWMRLEGALNPKALQEALRRLVERHQSLRFRFENRNGFPVLSVDPDANFGWQVHDLSGFDVQTREAAITKFQELERRTPFDLEHGPLCRFMLLKLGSEEHLLLRSFHHIATDGWSTGIFNRELSAFYTALQRGEPSDGLPPLSLQYGDFAHWQREWFHEQRLERQLHYWQETLAEAPTLELPVDRARSELSHSRCQRHSFVIPEKLVQQLESFGQAERVTPFIPLLAAWQILLARHSGQDDILTGVPMANRRHAAWESLIGFFVNTLVMRIQFDAGEGFRSLVQRVRQSVLEAFEHQDVPFEMLVEKLNPVRDLTRHPLVQVMFELREDPTSQLELEGLAVTAGAVPPASTHFDLDLSILQQPGDWRGFLSWNAELFDEATIHRMTGHFLRLLQGLLEDVERPVFGVKMLTDEERTELLTLATGPEIDYPQAQAIHEIIDQWSASRPDAVAFSCEDRSLTHRELTGLSDELAKQLRRCGIGRESKVVVLLNRSVNFPVAVLGVLKAGGCFVPLAADTPRDRIAFILKDTAAEIVIVQTETGNLVPPTQAKLLYLNSGRVSGSTPDEPSVGVLPCLPTSLAYIIYTSGSTGQPKGVMIEHKDLLAHCQGLRDVYEIGESDCYLHMASLGFDAAVEYLMVPLLAGSKVLMMGDQLWEPRVLTEQIAQHGITVIAVVPAYWGSWLATLNPALMESHLQSLRIMDVGADVLPIEAAAQWLALDKGAKRLLNAYGPTEITVTALLHEVKALATDRVPIGRPLPNRRAYILDRWGNLAPRGAVGELCLGGIGVGRGYLNLPELTAEKFVSDPFKDGVEARMYRSGDMARWLPEGVIDFLGRRDHQIKIRGHRIELGEIEAQLRALEEVQEAVVLLRLDNPANPRLVAYFVTKPGFTGDAATFKALLAERLAPYMMPSIFVFLPQLPMTASGKVDRKKLSSLPLPEMETELIPSAPRNETERLCMEIWKSVLSNEAVGVHDNFFDLGGHSLLALKVFSQLREATGVNLPVRVLFEAPTVALLAQRVAQERKRTRQGGNKLTRHLVSLRVGQASQPPIILVPGGWGGLDDLKFFSELLATLPGDGSVAGVDMRLLDEKYPFPDQLAARAKRLLKEVQSLHPAGTIHLIAEGIAGVIAVEMARLAAGSDLQIGKVILLQSECPSWKARWLPGGPAIGPQSGAPDQHRTVPVQVQRYHRILRRHRVMPFSHPLDLVISEPLATSGDPSLGWSRVQAGLQIHAVPAGDEALPEKLLGKALELIQPEAFSDSVNRPSSAGGSRHLVCLQKGDGQTPPLVIIPGGESGENELLVFARMIRSLPPRQSVYGVNMRLLDSRCPYPASLAERSQRLLQEVLALTGTGGFHLLGECLAGVVAFELAKQVLAAGHRPLSLLMLDAVAPANRAARPDLSVAKSIHIRRYLQMLYDYRLQRLDLSLDLVFAEDAANQDQAGQAWRAYGAEVREHLVPGNHHGYIREHAATTAAVIATILQKSNP